MSYIPYISIHCNVCGRIICAETTKITYANKWSKKVGWRSQGKQHLCPKCNTNRRSIHAAI